MAAAAQTVGNPARTTRTFPSVRQVARVIPAILAFALLLGQMALPWSARHYVTQDGSSHVYGATILLELLAHPHSPVYASWYHIQWILLPNWAATLLFAAATLIAGAAHAEQLVASVLAPVGFLAFAYAARSFAPRWSPWSPLALLVLQTTFAVQGFYNFEIGMMFGLVAIGFYARRRDQLTVRRAVVLGLGLIALFFTHLIPAALACLTIGLMSGWRLLWAGRNWRAAVITQARDLALSAAALLPALILVGIYLFRAPHEGEYDPQLRDSLRSFPMGVFWFTTGAAGRLEMLWPLVLGCILMAMVRLRRAEWRSVKGVLAVMVVVSAVLYFVAPDSGFGGSAAKIRFSWAMFVFGALLITCAQRMQIWRLPIGLYAAVLLAASLGNAYETTQLTSRAMDQYLAAVAPVPAGKTLLRIRYNVPKEKLGLPNDLPFDALGHADAFAATQGKWLAISDYEAAASIFPVMLTDAISQDWRIALWSLEHGEGDGAERLQNVRKALPAPADYVLVIGEQGSADCEKAVATLAGNMRLVSAPSGGQSPYRLFERIQ